MQERLNMQMLPTHRLLFILLFKNALKLGLPIIGKDSGHSTYFLSLEQGIKTQEKNVNETRYLEAKLRRL